MITTVEEYKARQVPAFDLDRYSHHYEHSPTGTRKTQQLIADVVPKIVSGEISSAIFYVNRTTLCRASIYAWNLAICKAAGEVRS